MKSRAGTTFTEIMVALAILALTIVPIYEFFTKMSEAPAISEDTVYAEILATRILERYGAVPYEDLEAMSSNSGVIDELFEDDRKDDWYLAIPQYKQNFGVAKGKFRGKLKVTKIEEGLLCLDVIVTWKPSERGAGISGTFSYALMKFVARSDLGIVYQEEEPEL